MTPSTQQRRSRIDGLLVERGLVSSRQQAQAMLLAGDVRVDGAMVTKPGSMVQATASIEVLRRPAYVSRGGDKLAHALRAFDIDPAGRTCLDVGASTGGFTDCLLQRGADTVYAVDVGYGVLDYGIRQDPRVVVMERTNARKMEPLPARCSLLTMDVSFIGVEKVLPSACRSLEPGADLIVLVKPQFQGRREEVGKKGVVRDRYVHAAVIGRVVAWTSANGLRLHNLTTSPLLGPEGNKEFFLHLNLERYPEP
jgi:23S rRNA (cytidine1920-2'-O)/16S rRNA (cytidine1409-2'-O)-methyltransferase